MKNRNHELISTVRSALHKHYGKEAVWWGRIVPHVEISGFVIKLASDDLVHTLLRSTAKAQPVMVSKIPKKIAIEVLDNWVTCDNTDKTLGVMDQKKRFLEILGFQILTVLYVDSVANHMRCVHSMKGHRTLFLLLKFWPWRLREKNWPWNFCKFRQATEILVDLAAVFITLRLFPQSNGLVYDTYLVT